MSRSFDSDRCETIAPERMPPLAPENMTPEQRAAADALIAGPRGAVFGPFIPLLRSPELMDRLQQVGEYLRFRSALPTKLNEFVMLVVARRWTQQFEWRVHAKLAEKAGLKPEIIAALADGRRPEGMATDEAAVYDFCEELLRTCGVCDATYDKAVALLGETGVIDMIGVLGYFTTVSMVMNVARTPPLADEDAPLLRAFPF